jgi:hypothetical protein
MRRASVQPIIAAVLTTALLVTTLVPASNSASQLAPIPQLKRWETQMVTFGQAVCDSLATGKTPDERLSSVYYDAQRVFLQMADYTGNGAWNVCAQRARMVYRDEYVLRHKGQVPGYWNFTHGLTIDYLRTGDVTSKQAVMLLAWNAAFARDGTPLDWTKNAKLSREVAYTIMAYLNAEKVGASRRDRLQPLVNQALGHLDQWFVSKTASYVQPFMVGLTMEALIMYYEAIQDPRIPPAIKAAMDSLWTNAWQGTDAGFWYESSDKRSGAPDLNLLIAPAYAWLYRSTGEPAYRDRGDQVFAGGVQRAYLGQGKQFNQNYRWSFDYVKWRTAGPSS